MFFDLPIGLTAEIEMEVQQKDTAVEFGSGEVAVFATPKMIGLMENAAVKAVDPHLPEGFATVGTRIDVKHIAATPVGMTVRAHAKLTGTDNRKLTFWVEAFDEVEKIGEGTHERFIIDVKKFSEKAERKGKE